MLEILNTMIYCYINLTLIQKHSKYRLVYEVISH